MKQYKIFEHPTGKIEAVKQGWSWPAFFIGTIWTFFKRMWALGGIIIAVFAVIGGICGAAGVQNLQPIGSILYTITAIVLGLNGNDWREKNLQARGYEFRTTVTAVNPEGATALYIKEKQEQEDSSKKRFYRAEQSDARPKEKSDADSIDKQKKLQDIKAKDTSSKPEHSKTESFDAFYAQAWDEINEQNKTPDKALWAKSFADAQGNESLAKANYLKVRAEQLSKEYGQNITKERERKIELMRQQDALALEKRKLDRQAALEAELKEMEAKRKETGRDDKFIAYDNGTVLDTSTKLMWAAKDNGSDINWADAKAYCYNYRGGGYTNWRMPTMDELTGLYDENKESSKIGFNTRIHLTKLIMLSNVCLWALTSGSPESSYFIDMSVNKWQWAHSLENAQLRVLPVRSGK